MRLTVGYGYVPRLDFFGVICIITNANVVLN